MRWFTQNSKTYFSAKIILKKLECHLIQFCLIWKNAQNISVFLFCFSRATGPEPVYTKIVSGYKTYTHDVPFMLKYNNAVLPELTVAYETWGELNSAKDNAVIIHAGLSASSHARSHDVSFHSQYSKTVRGSHLWEIKTNCCLTHCSLETSKRVICKQPDQMPQNAASKGLHCLLIVKPFFSRII